MIPQAEGFQAGVDVGRRIIEFVSPVLFFPDEYPGRAPAILKINHLMAKRSQAEQVLEAVPGLATQAGATDGPSENDGHRPALSIRLPNTFSAQKYSRAISKAAWH